MIEARLLAAALGHCESLALCPDDCLAALERLGRSHATPDALRNGIEEVRSVSIISIFEFSI